MASRVENSLKKNLDPNSAYSLLPFSVNFSSWWNSSKKQQMSQSVLENATLKFESPPQIYYDVKQFGLQLPDQESSTAQSIDQSHHKYNAIGRPNAHDQCISSESDQDEHCGKSAEIQTKPFILLSNPEFMLNHTSQVHTAHPYADPYYVGIWNVHGPQALNQAQIGSHMMRMSPMRVPLPLGLTEDQPIYVNAKQYHGILRRRRSRAKLEALNKVVKDRKPYLHESRHMHALNRARGSGGRFLSTKKSKSEFDCHDSGTGANSAGSDITSVSNGSMSFGGRSDRLISNLGEPGILQFTGGLTFGSRLQCPPTWFVQ